MDTNAITPFMMQTRHAAHEIQRLIRRRYDELNERPEFEIFRRAALSEYHEQHQDEVRFL